LAFEEEEATYYHVLGEVRDNMKTVLVYFPTKASDIVVVFERVSAEGLAEPMWSV